MNRDSEQYAYYYQQVILCSSQDLSTTFSGQLPIFQHNLSIDNDMVHTDGGLVRFKGGALIREGLWIENCHIRTRSYPEDTPIG